MMKNMFAKASTPCLALMLIATSPAERDWKSTLREDAQALHDNVEQNHPGSVNVLDPDFSNRNADGLHTALNRAEEVSDYPGYLWAMRAYVAAFDDGHIFIRTSDAAPDLLVKWPGFFTGYDDAGRQIVRTKANDFPVALGAELIECDGTPAATWMADNVGAFRGRWDLLGQRMIHGGRLFMDVGNPYVSRPTQCTFSFDGTRMTANLNWRQISDEDLAEHFGATAPRFNAAIGSSTFGSGTRWFSLSDFDGEPDSEVFESLTTLIAEMRRDGDAIRSAPRVVLDLRGNGGGSSNWSKQIAEIIWGNARLASLEGGSGYVEWRASPDNIATMEEYRQLYASSAEASQEMRQWLDIAVTGMTSVLAAGEPLWREPSVEEPSSSDNTNDSDVIPPSQVYILTDWTCASACLDAVDLWRALGAIQVGQETSADTLYMDVREAILPSGLSTIGMPMKVYRDRARGSNEPWSPVYQYSGDMRSTQDIEAWIARLPIE